ncbi:MAG: Hpt domain-containing protein [Lachnospiraceae bacterium]|nr:Hpt domain-containing protein [Lachnospiraceae bacterium]
MTIEELYAAIDSDYNEVLSRLINATLIVRLVKLYKNDANYASLCAGMEERDREKIFTASHTIKGLALNLGFKDLAATAAELCEATRNSYAENVPALFEAVAGEQKKVMDLIDQLD